MPWRQYTGASVQRKPKKTLSGRQKRSLNALAIAEQQNPIKLKFRSSRFGALEGNNGKEARYDEEDSKREEQTGNLKRRKVGGGGHLEIEAEAGSDSEGNRWVIGQIGSNDDSDLDSDEAMGESGQGEAEGYDLESNSIKNSEKVTQDNAGNTDLRTKRRRNINLDGDEGRQVLTEESNGFGDDAVDLAAVLDESDDDPTEASNLRFINETDPIISRLTTKESPVNGNKTFDDEGSLLSDSETDDDIAKSTKLASLQTLVNNIDEKTVRSNNFNGSNSAQESLNPSEFGLIPKKKLTVNDILPSVTDPRLKKSLKLLASNKSATAYKQRGIPKKLEVPLPKRQQDRLDRAAAYEKSKETLNRWIDTVKYNRRAEHLIFPLKDPDVAVPQGSQRLLSRIHSRTPTDLESAVQNILTESGIGSKDEDLTVIQADTFKELPPNNVSLRDVQARTAELRKARELLFREETRSKRIKKIKSKSYRRVHRKERERNAEREAEALMAAGIEESEDDNERINRRRAEERMGARHRDSKWARGVRESGMAAWDRDARNGVAEMARRGEELRRRIKGKDSSSDEDTSESPDLHSGDEAENWVDDPDQFSVQKKRRDLRKLDEMNAEFGAHGTNLFSMKFMKNADALPKQRNDAEIESLRRDVLVEESPSQKEEEEEVIGRRFYGPIKKKSASLRSSQRKEKGELEEGDDSDIPNGHLSGSLENNDLEIIVDDAQNDSKSTQTLRSTKKALEHADDTRRSEVFENPWLSGGNHSKQNRKRRDPDTAAIISNNVSVKSSIPPDGVTIAQVSPCDAGGEENLLNNFKKAQPSADLKVVETESEDESDVRLPFIMRNQDLIRRAFAGDDVVAEFEKEKMSTVHEEEEKTVDSTLPGWGNWTGAGISKKEQKRNKGKVLMKQAGIRRTERQDAKLDRVIINEKRSKKVTIIIQTTLGRSKC